ncbi:MAG: rRNA pseudouridine synthase [Bryobacterales bacterium]|nr:rRNA pseudouridine synthase [Bryobacterales bacterium]
MGRPSTAQALKKTLDRILSRAGVGSRTEARKWVAEGRVAVNGKTIRSADAWADPARDRITFDGKPLQAKRKIYLLLYKPAGYLTTYKDPQGRPTVYDLLKDVDEWIFPAGRLDQDTSGLLLMTNDTQFGDFVTSPESHVPKTYLVKASTVLTEDQLQQLREGVELADSPTRPAQVTRVRDSAKCTFFEITITEGRNRQVRRIVEALGAKTLKLVRTRIGLVGIGDLQIGKWRELSAAEVKALSPRQRILRQV